MIAFGSLIVSIVAYKKITTLEPSKHLG